MTLIVCPECSKDVSDKALSCPGCGFPITKTVSPSNKGGWPVPSEQEELKGVGFWLAIGIFLFPYIFAWFTLRKGHSAVNRILSFGWLFLLVFAVTGKQSGAVKTTTYSSQQPKNLSSSYGLSNNDLAWHAKNTYGWSCPSIIEREGHSSSYYYVKCSNGKWLRVYPRKNKHPRITNAEGGWN